MRLPSFRILAGFLALCALAACGGGSGGGTGTVYMAATDAPFPATDGCLASALIEVDKVEVQGEGGFVEIPLTDTGDADSTDGIVTLDLLDLRSGLEQSLAIGELPTGTYHQIRLHIVSSTMQFTDGSPDQEFKIPSGMQSGLKINVQPNFVIAEGQTTPLVIDFDLSNSFHVTGTGNDPTCDDLKLGENQVLFNPVVHAMNADATGVVSGVVSDATPAPVADVEVSAFPAGTVVDDTTVPSAATFSAPAPVETTDAALGSYALRLDPGSYDLYVRAQGATDRTLAVGGVTVTAGAITSQDLAIP